MMDIEPKPFFLIAVPQLGDPNFFHSVVLVLNHNAAGAMGIVLNNTIEMNLGKFSQSEGIDCHEDLFATPLFKGGPVEPYRGWILHKDDTIKEAKEILSGIFLSGSSEVLRILLEKGSTPLRLLLGCAGWAPGQLEQEMAQGAWIPVPVKPQFIFETEPAQTWEAVLNDMGVDPTQLSVVGKGVH